MIAYAFTAYLDELIYNVWDAKKHIYHINRDAAHENIYCGHEFH